MWDITLSLPFFLYFPHRICHCLFYVPHCILSKTCNVLLYWVPRWCFYLNYIYSLVERYLPFNAFVIKWVSLVKVLDTLSGSITSSTTRVAVINDSNRKPPISFVSISFFHLSDYNLTFKATVVFHFWSGSYLHFPTFIPFSFFPSLSLSVLNLQPPPLLSLFFPPISFI
jgi:hypothetical protein